MTFLSTSISLLLCWLLSLLWRSHRYLVISCFQVYFHKKINPADEYNAISTLDLNQSKLYSLLPLYNHCIFESLSAFLKTRMGDAHLLSASRICLKILCSTNLLLLGPTVLAISLLARRSSVTFSFNLRLAL